LGAGSRKETRGAGMKGGGGLTGMKGGKKMPITRCGQRGGTGEKGNVD